MDKQQLKVLYRSKKITAKEYFLKLGRLMGSEAPPLVLERSIEINGIFDGKLPL